MSTARPGPQPLRPLPIAGHFAKKSFFFPPRPFSPSPLLPPSFPLSSRVSPAMLAAKRQDGGLFKGPPYPGYPFIMIPDLSSPYLPNGSLSPTARTVSAFFFFLFFAFVKSPLVQASEVYPLEVFDKMALSTGF